MSNAVNALKLAVEFEKQALEKYNEAIPHVTNKQTREAIEKYASEKNEQIDSLHWMIMAEAGQLETEEAPVAEEGAPKAGKCPFTAPLAEMGIDITKMGDMPNMAEMMKDMPKDETHTKS
jgi:rubrerythrin